MYDPCNFGLLDDKEVTLLPTIFPYKNSASLKELYANAEKYFTNKNRDTCGPLTGCKLFDVGCS